MQQSAAEHPQVFHPAAPTSFTPQPGLEWVAASSSTYGAEVHGYPAYSAGMPTLGAARASFGDLDDEPPLLEELGIDMSAIVRRTIAILTARLSQDSLDTLDLGGPLIFMAALGVAHLLVGKLHFGYILGWTVVSASLIWFVLNSMIGSPADGDDLGLYTCCCLLGYALLPLVAHALLALLLPRRSTLSVAFGALAVAWSAATAAKLFVRRSSALRGRASVIMYPACLMYTAFALLTLY